jgi:hypothetical protein
MPNGSGAPSIVLKMARASSEIGFLPFVVPLAKKYLPAFESDPLVELA